MKKILKLLSTAESGLCIFMFLLMIGCCVFQVLNRNIFQFSVGWPEELARFSMIWMALLGSEMGLRYGKQMCVEAVVDILPFGLKKVVEVLGDLVCAVFAGAAGYFSIGFIQTTIASNQISTALSIPMWIVYLILPVVFFSMCAYEIVHLVSDAAKKRDTLEEKKEG